MLSIYLVLACANNLAVTRLLARQRTLGGENGPARPLCTAQNNIVCLQLCSNDDTIIIIIIMLARITPCYTSYSCSHTDTIVALLLPFLFGGHPEQIVNRDKWTQQIGGGGPIIGVATR